MSPLDEAWATRLHAAVDDHPGALAFDAQSCVAAGRKRVRRRRAAAIAGTLAATVVIAAGGAVVTRGGTPKPSSPVVPAGATLGVGTNGWVALETNDGGGDILLVRPGHEARRLEGAGSPAANDACPVWSPDGTRLLFGRLTASSTNPAGTAELVIVPLDDGAAAGTPTVIELDGFSDRPCAIWAQDGRWVAFAGNGQVWVVDTQTSAVRRLPDLRPSDLEWRPGTDELAITGDLGSNRGAPTVATPVTVYSVSTRALRRLGPAEAARISWSPDGRTLAYTDAESDGLPLRLIDADGAHDRVLVANMGQWPMQGIGPVWSPTGDRIAYMRGVGCCESSVVVLVEVADGAETVIQAPQTDGRPWWPFAVSWSPDGTTLLYTGWMDQGANGLIAVRADAPRTVTVLTGTSQVAPNWGWTPVQMWGREPG